MTILIRPAATFSRSCERRNRGGEGELFCGRFRGVALTLFGAALIPVAALFPRFPEASRPRKWAQPTGQLIAR